MIVKHANPCGVAIGSDLVDAYRKALRCDPTSAFGGIVAVNRQLDRASATAIAGIFTEVVVAPEADEEALGVFAAKKNLRLLLTGGLPDPAAAGLAVAHGRGRLPRAIARHGGPRRERAEDGHPSCSDTAELEDLKFAWRVCKHVKSNAIVYAKDGASVGIGAGQMSRVDAARIAAWKAEEAAKAAGLDGEPRQGRGRRLGRVLSVSATGFWPRSRRAPRR